MLSFASAYSLALLLSSSQTFSRIIIIWDTSSSSTCTFPWALLLLLDDALFGFAFSCSSISFRTCSLVGGCTSPYWGSGVPVDQYWACRRNLLTAHRMNVSFALTNSCSAMILVSFVPLGSGNLNSMPGFSPPDILFTSVLLRTESEQVNVQLSSNTSGYHLWLLLKLGLTVTVENGSGFRSLTLLLILIENHVSDGPVYHPDYTRTRR